MYKEPSFWKYLIFDDNGKMIGLSDEAGEKEQKEFEKWLIEEQRLKQKGKKR